ncbi:hypothetical protein J3R83DRAFT_13053 [Lanmaoa asiatica]|nr:hypothetical protein J3R83DRAFT_13053 [Lanmaoa asiatica]
MDPGDNMDIDHVAAARGTARDEHIRQALQILRQGRISLLDCLFDVLDPSKQEFAVQRRNFLANSSGKFTRLLDLIFETDSGRKHLLDWMEPHAIDLVSDRIASEMDDVKRRLGGTVTSITPESLRIWDINTFIGSVVNEKAPITGRILQTAAQTDRAKQKNKVKSCSTVRTPVLYTTQYNRLIF